MKKIAFVLILSIMLSFGMSIIASAEEYGVMPRLNNGITAERYFYIIGNDAVVRIEAYGITNITSRITVNVTLEKRALFGLWWKEIANWESSTTKTNHTFEFSHEAESGTYRCNFEIKFEGSGGSADIITDQLTISN